MSDSALARPQRKRGKSRGGITWFSPEDAQHGKQCAGWEGHALNLSETDQLRVGWHSAKRSTRLENSKQQPKCERKLSADTSSHKRSSCSELAFIAVQAKLMGSETIVLNASRENRQRAIMAAFYGLLLPLGRLKIAERNIRAERHSCFTQLLGRWICRDPGEVHP